MTQRNPAVWIGLIVSFGLCFAAAGIGGIATSRSVGTWYQGLAKPSWNPPGWVFGPVWTVLYAMMAVAAWLVWRDKGLAGARLPLALFAVQLALNALWSWLFFGFRMPGVAFAELVALCLAIVATVAAFWRTVPVAAWLMVPYLAWCTFAAVLNFALWRLNA